MWIAVVLLCINPMDVKTCDVLVRTSEMFFTEEACEAQVSDDVRQMMNGQRMYNRYKCYQMQGSA